MKGGRLALWPRRIPDDDATILQHLSRPLARKPRRETRRLERRYERRACQGEEDAARENCSVHSAGNFTSTYVMCFPLATRKLCGILAGMWTKSPAARACRWPPSLPVAPYSPLPAP